MKKYILLFLLATVTNTIDVIAQADTQTLAHLNEYLIFLNNAGFSGQILVAEKSKVICNQSFGFANKETMYPITSATSFNIGSLTKQFTATAIMWLEQNDKLSTSDTLGKFWETLTPDKKSITIHQLLTHTSGFGREVFKSSEPISKDDLLNQIFSSKLLNTPGTLFQYSNSGYEVLAAIVEKVSGIPFKEFIRQKFIIPYNFNDTYFNTDSLIGIDHKIAFGYNEWKQVSNSLSQSTNWSTTGASNILSTMEDLFKWFSLVHSEKILNPVETSRLFSSFVKTDEDEEYSYGWYSTKTSAGKQLIYHGGDIKGFHSEFRYYPEEDRVIIILTNQELFTLGIFKYRIASNIYKTLSGTQVDFPIETTKLKTDILYKYCGIYQLDSSNSFKIWINGGQPTIGTWGQMSINLIVSKKSSNQINLDSISEKSLQLMNSVINGNEEIAKKMLSPKGFDFYYPSLKEKYMAYSMAMDGNPSISLGGTIPAYWRGDGFSRTYLKLNFATGSSTFYLGWGAEDINDVTINNDRPFPLIYPLIFKNENNCLVYDLDNANKTTIDFIINKNGVVTDLIITDNSENKFIFKKIE